MPLNINASQVKIAQNQGMGEEISAPKAQTAQVDYIKSVRLNPTREQGGVESKLNFSEIAKGAFSESASTDGLKNRSVSVKDGSDTPSLEKLSRNVFGNAASTDGVRGAAKARSVEKPPESDPAKEISDKFQQIDKGVDNLGRKMAEIKAKLQQKNPDLKALREELSQAKKPVDNWTRENEGFFSQKLGEVAGKLGSEVSSGRMSRAEAKDNLFKMHDTISDKSGKVHTMQAEAHNLEIDIGLLRGKELAKQGTSDEGLKMKMAQLKNSKVDIKELKQEQTIDSRRSLESATNSFDSRVGSKGDEGPLTRAAARAEVKEPGSFQRKIKDSNVARGLKNWVRFETGKSSSLDMKAERGEGLKQTSVGKGMVKDVKLIVKDIPMSVKPLLTTPLEKGERVDDLADRAILLSVAAFAAPSYAGAAMIGGPAFVTLSAVQRAAKNAKAAIEIERSSQHAMDASQIKTQNQIM